MGKKHIPKQALAFAFAGEVLASPHIGPHFGILMFHGPGGHGGPGGPGGPGGFGPGGHGPHGHGPHGYGPHGPGSIGGRLYHGNHDPGLPGAGYTSLKKGDRKPKKRNWLLRLRDWWFYHTHEL